MLLSFIHFNDSKSENTSSDRLFKIPPMVDILVDKQILKPGSEGVFDHSMVPFSDETGIRK